MKQHTAIFFVIVATYLLFIGGCQSDEEKQAGLNEAFLEAVWNGTVNEAGTLLEQGADINAQDKYGATALLYGAHQGHVEIIRMLLEYEAVNADIPDSQGTTALMEAILNRSLENATLLLTHGADVHARNIHRNTALMFAASGSIAEMVTLVLAHGAEINAQNERGMSALMHAAWKGEYENVRRLLLHHHAEVNLRTIDGKNARMLADEAGKRRVVELLTTFGAKDFREEARIWPIWTLLP